VALQNVAEVRETVDVTGLLYFDLSDLTKYRVLNYDIIKSRVIFGHFFEDHLRQGFGGRSGV